MWPGLAGRGIMPGFDPRARMHQAPEHYLDKDPAGGRIMAHARLLQKLAGRFAAIAPSPLTHGVRVVNFKNGTLVLHAESGAIAVKLRQMSRRLCDGISQSGVDCEALEVKVLPRDLPGAPPQARVKPLSRTAFSILEQTRSTLPSGNLRQALDELLARAAKAE